MTGQPLGRVRIVLDLVATLGIVAASGMLVWLLLNQPVPAVAEAVPLPEVPVDISGGPTLGSPDAGLVVVEFSDFECPYCARFGSEILPVLRNQWIDTGQVQLVFRHLPLNAIHHRAIRAAHAAECARRQGRFWRMHDQLFRGGTALSDGDLSQYALEAGLSLEAFATCMDGPAPDEIRRDLDLARFLGLAGTPTFFIGERRGDGRVDVKRVLAGAVPAEAFGKALEEVRGQLQQEQYQ